MDKDKFKTIGVMSGTSRDGIDFAYVEFKKEQGIWDYNLLQTDTLTYSLEWEEQLGAAHHFDEKQIEKLDETYTAYLAQKIRTFIDKYKLNEIDAICSHGHTIFHQPEHRFTLQIGNLPQLADLVQEKVVCDFRKQDVNLGGQGAPLVPIGDELLFRDYAACLNLGGFANISLQQEGERTAYDICPVNTVLNRYAQKLGQAFDKDGEIAKSAIIDFDLLERLNGLGFYRQNPPKSLGIEWVEEEIMPILEGKSYSPETILATFTRHSIDQLSQALSKFTAGKVLITGGGALNTFLIQSLNNRVGAELVVPDEKLVEYKEALIFGLLGVLKLRGEINVLRSVTGASKNHSSGKVFIPANS